MGELSCGGLADVADELALGALTGRERAQALAHLDSCEACREITRRRLAVAAELPGLLPARDPPPGFEEAVMARLGLPVPGPAPERGSKRRPLQGSWPLRKRERRLGHSHPELAQRTDMERGAAGKTSGHGCHCP